MHLPLDAQIGWGTLLRRTLRETVQDNCLGMSAQLAYYFFLSLFPALLIVVAATSFLPSNTLDGILAWLGAFTPPDVLRVVSDQLRQVARSGHAGLLTAGALGALWSSSSAMSAIIDTVNRAYGIREGRSWWKVQMLAIFMTVVMSLFVLVSFTLVVSGPELAEIVARRAGLGPVFTWTWWIAQWPVVVLLISVGFRIVYYLAPDAEQMWSWVGPGSYCATFCWLLISLALRFYVAHFGQFNRTYGTLGAAVVVLLWFYLSGLVLLLGAELNSELEHASPYGKNEGEKVPGEHRHWLFRTRRHGGIGDTPEADTAT